jgi:hypothetical protein
MIRAAIGPACLLAALALAGCETGPAMGEVSGTVTVDGQTPAEGASITFFPTDGKSQTAGASIVQGRYTAQVPVGTAKVEIRAPRPAAGAGGNTAGPGAAGPGGGGFIEESLPAKYNNETTLTIDVKPGKNEKNWDLSTK